MATQEPHPTVPKVFISYSWDDAAHKEWVKQLAIRLRKDGVDVTLDRWHAAPGDQIPAFMERAVRNNDFVIAVCTPRFKARSDGRGGGVGYEGDIMTAYAFTDGAEKKFIPVLRRGDWIEAAPTWLLGRVRIDLSGDPYSESEYEELLRTLHGVREVAPPIGDRPNFADKRRPQASPSPAPAAFGWTRNVFYKLLFDEAFDKLFADCGPGPKARPSGPFMISVVGDVGVGKTAIIWGLIERRGGSPGGMEQLLS